jgi:hypothetical protein
MIEIVGTIAQSTFSGIGWAARGHFDAEPDRFVLVSRAVHGERRGDIDGTSG